MNDLRYGIPVLGTGDGKVLFKDTNFLDVIPGHINTDLGLETFRGCTVTGGKSTINNYGGIDYDATNSPPLNSINLIPLTFHNQSKEPGFPEA